MILSEDAGTQSEAVSPLLNRERRAGREPKGIQTLGFDPETRRVTIAAEGLKGDEFHELPALFRQTGG